MHSPAPFTGKTLCNAGIYHGEGPTYDPHTDTAWWFSIANCELHELNLSTGEKRMHVLPFMASVLGRIDDRRQMIASEQGIHIRDVRTGALELIAPIEFDQPHMRSNDGRIHQSGALWFGTMTKTGEGRKGAGAIYHVAGSKVTVLYKEQSIPNGICFSPDGATAYFVDTMENVYMRVAVDPATGLPVGEPETFIDGRNAPGGIDGSVCDKDGNIWNARWGIGEVQCFSPEGQLLSRFSVPAAQSTCPAFIGRDASRLLVTTARENMSDAEYAADPQAGNTFELGVPVNGRFEPDFKL